GQRETRTQRLLTALDEAGGTFWGILAMSALLHVGIVAVILPSLAIDEVALLTPNRGGPQPEIAVSTAPFEVSFAVAEIPKTHGEEAAPKIGAGTPDAVDEAPVTAEAPREPATKPSEPRPE